MHDFTALSDDSFDNFIVYINCQEKQQQKHRRYNLEISSSDFVVSFSWKLSSNESISE